MKTIEVSEETYNKIKDQLPQDEKKDISDLKDMVGEKYIFRTVTYHSVGEVVKIIGDFFFLKNASWIADSGRWSEAIKYGTSDEVEYVGSMAVNIKATVDITPWTNPLPTTSK